LPPQEEDAREHQHDNKCPIHLRPPKAEHAAAKWQTAMEVLLLVAEHDGPEMLARIGMLRAKAFRRSVTLGNGQ